MYMKQEEEGFKKEYKMIIKNIIDFSISSNFSTTGIYKST